MGVYPNDATLEMQNFTNLGSTLAAGISSRCSSPSRRVLENAGVWEWASSRSWPSGQAVRWQGSHLPFVCLEWCPSARATTKDVTSGAYQLCASVVVLGALPGSVVRGEVLGSFVESFVVS